MRLPAARQAATGAPAMRAWLVAGLLASGVAAAAYWRRTLSLDGALAAAGVGSIVFARGGWPAAGALLTFFLSSTALSKLGHARKQRAALAQAKGARRDAWQVLANGGIASLSVGLRGRRGGSACVGALACANADTWATELGMLAASRPRLITSLQVVQPGTSGGVTLEGLLASLGGALSVGLAWSALGGGRRGLLGAVLAGSAGCLIDSGLGATLQAVYRCQVCGRLSETALHAGCDATGRLVHGWRWMTNDTVNALATLAAAAIGEVALGDASVG